MADAAPLWEFERRARQQGARAIAGIDEAGRGPLAGPVVAAAVILDADDPIDGLNDSKKLTPRTRERLFGEIHSRAVAVGVGIVGPDEIDRINILQATLRAMRQAVDLLPAAGPDAEPDHLLIDALTLPGLPIPQQGIIKGDARSASIAAASIIAKVTRDRMMAAYDDEYPGYGFAGHKGYPTAAHKEAIRRLGTSPIHRLSFRGVR
ncbi:MAG: ribonuclease HII [Leptospirillia bacterium]